MRGGGPRCNTCARRWTRACMCKHTGAIEACNEPRVTRGQPVTELIRRRGSPAHVAPACSDINLRFLRSSMDPCSVFLKKILISPPLFSLYTPVGRKMGWNRFRGLEPFLDTRETFLASFLIKLEKFVLQGWNCRRTRNSRSLFDVFRSNGDFRRFLRRIRLLPVRYNFTTLLPRPTDLIIPANLASPFAGEIGNRERKPFPFLLRPSGDVRPPPPPPSGLTFPPLSLNKRVPVKPTICN